MWATISLPTLSKSLLVLKKKNLFWGLKQRSYCLLCPNDQAMLENKPRSIWLSLFLTFQCMRHRRGASRGLRTRSGCLDASRLCLIWGVKPHNRVRLSLKRLWWVKLGWTSSSLVQLNPQKLLLSSSFLFVWADLEMWSTVHVKRHCAHSRAFRSWLCVNLF